MTQFPIQNGSLSQKEINSEFYFVDIVFLLAGYKVIPGLFLMDSSQKPLRVAAV